jgi:hypothetical protein
MSEPLEPRDLPELDRVVEWFDLLKEKDPIWARAFGNCCQMDGSQSIDVRSSLLTLDGRATPSEVIRSKCEQWIYSHFAHQMSSPSIIHQSSRHG